MNLVLFDSYVRKALPEYIEETLDDGMATCCAFNRRGSLLAVGCHDGRTVIWDFETRSVAKILIGHVHPITNVSWSRDGRKLLTSSTDWNLRLWDVLSSRIDITVSFESPVLQSQIHPYHKLICLASPWMEPPQIVDLKTGEKRKLPTPPDPSEDFIENDNDTESDQQRRLVPNSVAYWSKRGTKIYTGNHNGIITVINAETLQIEYSFKIPGVGAPVKSIALSKDEMYFLVNSTDKVIRLFTTSDYSLIHEMSDVVNKIQWKKCLFSGDGEHIIGGSAQKAEHKIYIWSRQYSQLIKILEGPKEGILDLQWHPTRSIVVSCSTSGMVYIWNSHPTENWSAFAPGFTELEENEEYIEREDEFDIVDEDDIKKKKQLAEPVNEDTEVDILTIPKNPDFSSDDENEVFFLPTYPIPDTIPPLSSVSSQSIVVNPSSGSETPFPQSFGEQQIAGTSKPVTKHRKRGRPRKDQSLISMKHFA
jgi:COMPASS component SWD1